jgi:hypothetical protein
MIQLVLPDNLIIKCDYFPWIREMCGDNATPSGVDGAQASLPLEFQVPCSRFQVLNN